MRILVVAESINIEDSSGTKGRVALINNLVKSGFEVLVYHYSLKNIQLEGVSCYAIPENKCSVMYLLSRSQRIFSRHTKIILSPFFERLFGFSFTFFNDSTSIVKALKKCDFDPDLVLTLSKGTSFRPHHAMLKIPNWHNKWAAYVHDPFPFHFFPRPFTLVRPGYKFEEHFFRHVSEKAKHSIFPSQLLKEWMSSYFPDFIKTGVVIPHQNSNYVVGENSFPKYFDVEKFNLLHAGSLLKERSPISLLEGFEMFLKKHPDAKKDARLLLLGPASAHTHLLEKYKNSIPEVYIYNGKVAFDTVYHLQMNVSVNIILESKSEISPFLPGKFPHCVEANKTILLLSPYYSETKRLMGKEYDYWSEANDVDKIAKNIEKLYLLWKKHPDNLLLNREDLRYYLSADYLKIMINKLKLV